MSPIQFVLTDLGKKLFLQELYILASVWFVIWMFSLILSIFLGRKKVKKRYIFLGVTLPTILVTLGYAGYLKIQEKNRTQGLLAQIPDIYNATGQINQKIDEDGNHTYSIITVQIQKKDRGMFVSPNKVEITQREFQGLQEDPVWRLFWKQIEKRYEERATNNKAPKDQTIGI